MPEICGASPRRPTLAYMMGELASMSRRRAQPRVPVEAFCTWLTGDELRHAIVVDVAPDGFRLQRPLGGPRAQSMQLEVEIPGVDEIVWAQGEIRFDEVWRRPRAPAAGLGGIVRTTGVRLVAAAERHRRLLREYVMDTWWQAHAAANGDWFDHATCYRLG
jgi:hypothetical protein